MIKIWIGLHSCGKEFERRDVAVDERVLSGPRSVNYCANYRVYCFNEFESSNPDSVGAHVSVLQVATNLEKYGSPFSVNFRRGSNS